MIPLIHQQNGTTSAPPPTNPHAPSVQPLNSFQNIATVSTAQAPLQMDFHQNKKQRLGNNPQQAMNGGSQQAIMNNDPMIDNEDPDSGSEQKPGRKKSQAQIDRRRERIAFLLVGRVFVRNFSSNLYKRKLWNYKERIWH